MYGQNPDSEELYDYLVWQFASTFKSLTIKVIWKFSWRQILVFTKCEVIVLRVLRIVVAAPQSGNASLIVAGSDDPSRMEIDS